MSAKLTLYRDPNVPGKPTTGKFVLLEQGALREVCKTLELPWAGNAPGTSCIPEGKYKLAFVRSPRFQRNMWRVMQVPGRDGILIHSANFDRQLKGCIAPGLELRDIDGDGRLDSARSRDGMGRILEALTPYESTGIAFEVVRRN